MQNKTKRNIKKMIIAAGVMVSVIISSVTANADTKSPARTDSDFVVVAEADGNVDQTAVDRANELLNRLPVQVLKNFQNRGWRFLVTDKNIARTYYSGQYSSVQGMTLTMMRNLSWLNSAQKLWRKQHSTNLDTIWTGIII